MPSTTTTPNKRNCCVSLIRFTWLLVNAFIFTLTATSLTLGLFYNKATDRGKQLEPELYKLVLATSDEPRPLAPATLNSNPFYWISQFLATSPVNLLILHGTVCLWAMFGMLAMYSGRILFPYLITNGSFFLSSFLGNMFDRVYQSAHAYTKYSFVFGVILIIYAVCCFLYKKKRSGKIVGRNPVEVERELTPALLRRTMVAV
jgi:acyl dehydratase